MAKNIKGIIVEIGGDTSGLQKALTNVQKLANGFSKELSDINKALKFDSRKYRIIKSKMESFNK